MAVYQMTVIVVVIQMCRADLPQRTTDQGNGGLHTHVSGKAYQDLTTTSAAPDRHEKAETGKDIINCPRTCFCEYRVNYQGHLGLTVDSCRTDVLEELPALFEVFPDLDRLTIYLCHLSELPPDIGKSLPRLSYLDLAVNSFQHVPKGLFKMTYLRELRLQQNRIQMVPADLWKITSLENLDLRHNKIQTISCQIFNMILLKDIDLSTNALKSLDCDIENGLLERLDLSYNHLEEMSCSLKLDHLIYLDISHNAIETFPTDCALATHSHHIKHLDISFNRITVLHNLVSLEPLLYNLEELFLNNNNISIIDPYAFFTLHCLTPSRTLDLSYNKLSVLDSWPLLLLMSSTVNIDVSSNMLSKFTNAAGRHFQLRNSGSVLRMQHNQIRHFMDVFDGWNVSVSSHQQLYILLFSVLFDLGNNPLVCDCVDYEVFRYIQTSGDVRYKTMDLVCDRPMDLKGQNPGKSSLDRFVCDVNMKCPKGCRCTNVPHLSTLLVICTNYSQKDIPTVLPDLPKDSFAYHLNFSHQNMSMVTSRPYLKKTTEIILSNNALRYIHVWSSQMFRKIQKLHLDGNKLRTLPVSMISGITNRTATDVRLGNNLWLCDCTVMDMKDWIMSNPGMVTDQELIMCHSPLAMAGTKVMDIERYSVCPNKTAIYVVAVMAVLVLIGMTYFAVADRLKYANWQLVGSDECDGEGKEFDVFVSYASEDENYVEGFLIPELEQHDYRVCFHRVHFHGGKPILLNISEAIEKSKRTLVFFSDNFRESPFGMYEFRLAHHLDVENNTRRLITIKDTDLDMDNLLISESHYFQKYTYIRKEAVHFWRNLEHTLPRKRLGAEVP